MRRFVFGLIVGLLLGSVVTATAQLAQGYLNNWDVVQGGVVICQDPYVWPSLREIECE